MTSRPLAGATGAHKDVVLGVPASTAVTVRIVNKLGGVDYKTKDYQGMTGALPSGMPKPTVSMYDAALASPDRWMFGAVENSPGGCNNTSCYYTSLFWLYIIDRQGRVVWYYADATGNPTSSFQRIAKDGEYIWIEKRPFTGSGSKTRPQDDARSGVLADRHVPDLSDCIDVTSDGSLLYDVEPQWELREMNKAGTVRTIWSCPRAMGSSFMCYSNTVNWDAAERLDHHVVSLREHRRADRPQDRDAHRDVRQGDGELHVRRGGLGLRVPALRQHLVARDVDGVVAPAGLFEDVDAGGEQARVREFTIDRTNKKLIQKWVYSDGPEWAMYKGMVTLLPNGNYLANYGTGGVIREITPDKKTVFYVKFDVATGDDFFNKMVGNNVLINDLYALNGGGPK